jgi:hypothetical protein
VGESALYYTAEVAKDTKGSIEIRNGLAGRAKLGCH